VNLENELSTSGTFVPDVHRDEAGKGWAKLTLLLIQDYYGATETIHMTMKPIDVTEALVNEIQQTPEEYRPLLLRIVRSFREGVTLPSASESFRKGWQDVIDGNTYPVDDLWVVS
jgi:hypothetical protein